MPRLNTVNFKAVQGTTSISVDGVVPAPLTGVSAGNPHWLSDADSEIIYQNTVGTAFLQSYDVDTPAFTTQSAIGANEIGAGGGVWLGFVASGGNKGIRTNVPGYGPFSLAGPGDVDESGKSAYVQNFQAGQGMQAYDAAGALVSTWSVQLAAGYIIRCRTGIVAYPASGRVWYLRNLATGALIPIAQRTDTIFQCVPLVFGTRTLVAEVSGTQLTLREATGGVGYVLVTGDTFNVDLCALSATTVRVAYSTTAGEGPTALRLVDLDLTTGGTTLWTSASGSLVSSTGPTLNAMPVTTSGVVGGAGSRELQFIMRTPIVQPDRMLTREWWDFFNKLALLNAQPINLATEVTGVLPPDNGGTGNTDDTINGGNIIGIIPPGPLVNVPNVGYWTLLTAGPPLVLEHIVAQAGSWSPLMSGPDEATSTLILDVNGDCVPVWVASGNQTVIPPFVDDGSGAAIAIFQPVTGEAYT